MSMGTLIENLEKWFDSLSEKELLESWRNSTNGMSDTSQFEDFFNEKAYGLEWEVQSKHNSQYQIENNTSYNTLDKIGSFLFC